MTSIAHSTLTMPAALAAADKVLGKTEWIGDTSNHAQMEWLWGYLANARAAAGVQEIDAHATVDFQAHLAWLNERGWPAIAGKGDAWKWDGDLFLASCLSVQAKWQQEGMAFIDKNGVHRAKLEGVSVCDGTGAIIGTQGGLEFIVFPWAAGEAPPTSDRELYAAVSRFHLLPRSRFSSGILSFPMVHLHQVVEKASCVIGLRSGSNVVTDANEAFELKMNHIGGSARAMAQAAVSRGISDDPSLFIDAPFVVHVRKLVGEVGRAALYTGVFSAYVDRDSWKNPGAM